MQVGGSVSWEGKGMGGLYLYLWSPIPQPPSHLKPLGSRQGGCWDWVGLRFCQRASISLVCQSVPPNPWPCPTLSWPGLQSCLDGDWLSERSSWETVETVIWPVMPLCLKRMELLLLWTKLKESKYLLGLFCSPLLFLLAFLMLSLIFVLLPIHWLYISPSIICYLLVLSGSFPSLSSKVQSVFIYLSSSDWTVCQWVTSGEKDRGVIEQRGSLVLHTCTESGLRAQSLGSWSQDCDTWDMWD